jgi:SAM-dependent methyltransferase
MKDDPPTAHITFDDGHAYERFMGRWTRAAGDAFLDWVAPPRRAHWLEVGCGTGAFTELVLNRCTPASLIGIDPAVPQIEFCQRRPIGQRADFRVADAQALPFSDDSFDVIASALVLNFIADIRRALSEMRRAARADAVVAGYVWDFASARAPNSCLVLGLREIGISPPRMPGSEISTLDFLKASFTQAGFKEVAVTSFDVSVTFANFDDFWRAQTPPFSPLTGIIAGLAPAIRKKLIDAVRAQAITGLDGAISCSARANAIKAAVP